MLYVEKYNLALVLGLGQEGRDQHRGLELDPRCGVDKFGNELTGRMGCQASW